MSYTISREAYSYRADSSVPKFDDRGPIVFMDGECMLCSVGARLIAHLDTAKEFKICPIQSGLGEAIIKHYGLISGDPETWLYIVDGEAFGSIDAMIRVGNRTGGLGRSLVMLRLLPRFVQDWFYRKIARSRYRLFGRADLCAIPNQALRDRLIE